MTGQADSNAPRAGFARWTRLAAQAPIRLYKYAVSPFLAPSCRFEPTCSRYAMEAIETHGALKGLALAVRRILKCHPITWLGGSAGYDPVPPAAASRARPCADHHH